MKVAHKNHSFINRLLGPQEHDSTVNFEIFFKNQKKFSPESLRRKKR